MGRTRRTLMPTRRSAGTVKNPRRSQSASPGGDRSLPDINRLFAECPLNIAAFLVLLADRRTTVNACWRLSEESKHPKNRVDSPAAIYLL